MKTAWIITSAVNTGAGAYDALVRISQTQETINSILGFFPDAVLILVEGGKPFAEDAPDFEALRQRCHVFVDLRQNERIVWLHQNVFDVLKISPTNVGTTSIVDIAKSVAETLLLASVVEGLAAGQVDSSALDVDRIFKISGRYQLSPLFAPEAYRAADGRYVFRKRQRSGPNGEHHWFSSRMWSFPPGRLNDVRQKLQAVLRDLQDIGFRQQMAVDCEHLLFKYFHDDDLCELDHTHVMGAVGRSGRVVYD